MPELPSPEKALARLNGLDEFVGGCANGIFSGLPYYGQTIAQPWTLIEGNAYTPFSLNRIGLSYSFMSQGLVQTIVCQPVADAFRGGFRIVSPELGGDNSADIQLLQNTLKRSRKKNKFVRKINPNSGYNIGDSDIQTIMAVMNWGRLYGGAGLIVNTTQDFRTPFDIDSISQGDPLEFISADRWELILSNVDIWNDQNPTPFNYYGCPLHRSRVIKVLGTAAPSYIRLRLQGWGMSVLEPCVRAINCFIKFENLIFELLDEAKVDVYKIQGFNDQLLSDEGTANTTRRVALGNKLKNYQNALAMDAEDDWHQKQITWSGLAEIWNELRLNLSSALKIPMNKLFGQSATGFGGGEDAIENYNSIVEQIRIDAEPVVTEVVDLRCRQLFGYVPEYSIAWAPLKILDGLEAEQVKASQQKRTLDLFQQRLVTGREASRILKDDKLLLIETEVEQGLRDVEPQMPNEGEPSEGTMKIEGEKAKAAAKKSLPAGKAKAA